jgi:hypothetical protein
MSDIQPGLAQPSALRLAALPEDDVVVGQVCRARPDRGPDLLVLVIEVHENHVQAVLCDHDHHLSDPRWEWKLGKFRQLRTVQARASELGWEICKFGDAGPREA